MRRRRLIALTASGLVWPALAAAQRSNKIPVVGILWHAEDAEKEKAFSAPLRAGFSDLGYLEGKNIKFEERYPAEKKELFDKFAAELVDMKVDVIVAGSIPAALAAQRATSSIPIVLVANPDPVGLKLVASLSRPGGNITGLSSMGFDIAAKRLEVLKDAIPQVSRVALLVNPSNPNDANQQVADLRPAAEKLQIFVEAFPVREASQLDQTIQGIAAKKFGAIVIVQNALFYNERERIAELAIANRLTTMAPADVFVEAGALISYGPVWAAIFRNASGYVDKILKGANPAELPVQQPTEFQVAINLKTAKSIGIEFQANFLSRTDKVLE